MIDQAAAPWFVYLLRCADRSLYTGITTDVERRCAQHNAGRGARYTRSRTPVKLVYQETAASRGLALRRELQIKALDRRAKEALIRSGAASAPSTAQTSGRPARRPPATSTRRASRRA
ncbi:MAG: GIY-YIG nuclease family protein [Planctomycetes bacterium]|nr:GIY-YIG nuclease family protein [Planctomycetota bacterium]